MVWNLHLNRSIFNFTQSVFVVNPQTRDTFEPNQRISCNCMLFRPLFSSLSLFSHRAILLRTYHIVNQYVSAWAVGGIRRARVYDFTWLNWMNVGLIWNFHKTSSSTWHLEFYSDGCQHILLKLKLIFFPLTMQPFHWKSNIRKRWMLWRKRFQFHISRTCCWIDIPKGNIGNTWILRILFEFSIGLPIYGYSFSIYLWQTRTVSMVQQLVCFTFSKQTSETYISGF